MSGRFVVVNPNSTATVTAAIDRALEALRMTGGPAIECLTPPEGPPGIETQADVEQVVQPLCGLVRARTDAGAFVIACFSDPGLHLCREASARPVLPNPRLRGRSPLRWGIAADWRSAKPNEPDK